MKTETISRLFYEQASRVPNKIAIIQGDRSVTYAGLLALVQQQVGVLRAYQFERGDRLLTQLKSDIDFVVMLLAAADAGVTLVPLSPDLPPDAMNRAAAAVDTSALMNHGIKMSETQFNTRLRFVGKEDDLLLLITTSGSTGEPKPIMLKQGTKLKRVQALIDLYGITEEDITLISTPMCHSMGQRVALASVLTGGTLVIMRKWSALEWCRLVPLYQITFAIPVASQWKQIAEMRSLVPAKFLRTLRCVVASSAPLEAPVVDGLLEWLPCPLFNCYGTTEIAIATSGLVECGQPAPDIDIIIGDDDMIMVKTPLLFDGYYMQPEVTANAMAGDYFVTGDVGELDDGGILRYMGRIKELINVGGTKVYPQDVEGVLNQHPDVLECAAFPKDDPTFGEIVAVAFVVKEGAQTELHELQQFALPLLTDAQLPRAAYQVDVLPKTEGGKLQRMKLAGLTST